MKLYVCYGTWKPAPRPGGHPCGVAYHALNDAGYEPEVELTYGLGLLSLANELSPGRREVKRLTGNYWVPALVKDDGEVIQGSREIAEWARTHPAAATASPAASADATQSGSAAPPAPDGP